MYALLDFSKDMMTNDIPYLRVLGHNSKGLELLGLKTAEVPVISSLARAREIGDAAKKFAQTEEKIGDVYGLTLENKKNIKNEFSTPTIRL